MVDRYWNHFTEKLIINKKVVYKSMKLECGEAHISVVIPSSMFMTWKTSSRQKERIGLCQDLQDTKGANEAT